MINTLLTWAADYLVGKFGLIFGFIKGKIDLWFRNKKIKDRIDKEVDSQVSEVEQFAEKLKVLYKQRKLTKDLKALTEINKEITIYVGFLKKAKKRLHAGVVN